MINNDYNKVSLVNRTGVAIRTSYEIKRICRGNVERKRATVFKVQKILVYFHPMRVKVCHNILDLKENDML